MTMVSWENSRAGGEKYRWRSWIVSVKPYLENFMTKLDDRVAMCVDLRMKFNFSIHSQAPSRSPTALWLSCWWLSSPRSSPRSSPSTVRSDSNSDSELAIATSVVSVVLVRSHCMTGSLVFGSPMFNSPIIRFILFLAGLSFVWWFTNAVVGERFVRQMCWH